MQVIVHYPKTEDAKKHLSMDVADIHVKSMIYHLQQLNLSKNETDKLIEAVTQNHRA